MERTLNPEDFAKSFKQWREENHEISRINFIKKSFYEFLKESGQSYAGFQALLKTLGDDYTEDMLYRSIEEDGGTGIPTWLYADKDLKITAEELIKRPIRQNIVASFYHKVKTSNGHVAIIFPIEHIGKWVIHNIPVDDKPGSWYLQIHTTGYNVEFIKIQPLKIFAKGVMQ